MFENLTTAPMIFSYLAFAGFIFLPFLNIYRRAGLNPLNALWLFLPYSGLFIAMGYLAFKRWPVEPEKVKKRKKKNG